MFPLLHLARKRSPKINAGDHSRHREYYRTGILGMGTITCSRGCSCSGAGHLLHPASFALFPDERALIRSRAFWSGLLLCAVGFISINIFKGTGFLDHWFGRLIVLGHGITVILWGFRASLHARDQTISFPVISIYTRSCSS